MRDDKNLGAVRRGCNNWFLVAARDNVGSFAFLFSTPSGSWFFNIISGRAGTGILHFVSSIMDMAHIFQIIG